MMRQSMEMLRNPNAMRQAMRSQDLQLSNIENMPGGFNHLARMYEEVQQPMMEAQREAANARENATTSSLSQQQTAPSNAPLPNPWGTPSSSGATGNAPPRAMPNPFASMGGAVPGAMGTGANPFAGMSSMGAGMPSGMGDPAQMQAMLSNPFMQQMMQQTLNNPQALQQLSAMNPQLGQALQDPNVRAMLSNPAFMQSLGRMPPGALGGGMHPGMMGMGSMMPTRPPGMGGMWGMMPPPPPRPMNGLDFSALLAAQQQPRGATTPLQQAAQPQQPQQDPVVRFASELQQLQDMGFPDAVANLRALQATGGNVNAAVERLLSGR